MTLIVTIVKLYIKRAYVAIPHLLMVRQRTCSAKTIKERYNSYEKRLIIVQHALNIKSHQSENFATLTKLDEIEKIHSGAVRIKILSFRTLNQRFFPSYIVE